MLILRLTQYRNLGTAAHPWFPCLPFLEVYLGGGSSRRGQDRNSQRDLFESPQTAFKASRRSADAALAKALDIHAKLKE